MTHYYKFSSHLFAYFLAISEIHGGFPCDRESLLCLQARTTNTPGNNVITSRSSKTLA